MTVNNIITMILSILSIMISLITLIYTIINSQKMKKISFGEIEYSIRTHIDSARNNLNDALLVSDQSDKYKQFIRVRIEEFLNAYEEACAKYLDNKVDKKRFHNTYYSEIQKLVESKEFKEYFQFGSNYDAIKIVYTKWFKLD